MSGLQALSDLNRIVHEPSRLHILSILSSVDQADFLYLLNETGLTRGNLSSHLSKLEEAGYIAIDKTFRGKIPQTLCRLTPAGKAAFDEYRRQLKQIASQL